MALDPIEQTGTPIRLIAAVVPLATALANWFLAGPDTK